MANDRRQITFSVPRTDWILIRDESVKLTEPGAGIATLVRQWIEPHLVELRQKAAERKAQDVSRRS